MFCIISTHYYFLVGWGENFPVECGKACGDLEYFIVAFSTAYHIYDFLACAYLGLLDSDDIFHHGSVIIITMLLIITDQGTNYWVGVLAMSEFSIPFLHIRLILRNLELIQTKAYQMSEVCYFGCYFIGRVIIGTVLVWQIMTCD